MSTFSSSDSEVLLQCMIDGDSDPNCACLLSGGGPEMNTDISGPGVRISFYLQAYFLSLLSARSGSLEEISGALYTLVATNIALAVASFVLGFKSNPAMSLHDAIIVFYLLSLSWASVFTSLPAYNRFVRGDKTLQAVSVIQSYFIFAVALAVLVTARTFGSTPLCNKHAVAVFFKQFPALNAGLFVASAVLCIVIIVYTLLSFTDYRRVIVSRYRKLRNWSRGKRGWLKEKLVAIKVRIAGLLLSRWPGVPRSDRGIQAASPSIPGISPIPQAALSPDSKGKAREDNEAKARARKDKKRRKAMKHKLGDEHKNLDDDATIRPTKTHQGYDAGLFGTLLIELVVITILWALFVMNTEMLIVRNRFEGGGDGLGSDLWQFGQILPMFLVVLPLVSLVKVFRKLGLARRLHRRRLHKRYTRAARRERRTLAELMAEEEAARRFESSQPEVSSRNHFFGSAWTDMPFFTQAPPFREAGLGNQPAAHISLYSIHTVNSMPYGREEGQRVSRRSDSASPSASSSSSFSRSSSSSSHPQKRE